MPQALAPFPINQVNGGQIVADDLTAWASDGWTITGDAVMIDTWGGTDKMLLGTQQLFYWDNNPGAEQNPFIRQTKATKVYTEDDDANPLPPNRFVIVTVDVVWKLGNWDQERTGMWINGAFFAPSAGPTGTLVAPTVPMTGFGFTNEDGELEVALGIENVHPSFNLSIEFDNVRIASPDVGLDQIFYDAAVLYVAGNALSITRDGFSFDPQEVRESYDYPGKANEIEGLEEIVSARPVLRGAFMLAGEYQFLVYRPGGSWGTHSTIAGARTFTPSDVRTALGAGLSLISVYAIWRRPTDYLVVEFPRAICRSYALGSRDKDEGTIPVEIAALVPAGSSSKTVPYRIHTFPFGTVV